MTCVRARQFLRLSVEFVRRIPPSSVEGLSAPVRRVTGWFLHNGWATDHTRSRDWVSYVLTAVILLILTTGTVTVTVSAAGGIAAATARLPGGASGATLFTLGDGGSIKTSVGGVVSVLHDQVTPQIGTPEIRTYLITLTTLRPDASLKVTLTTRPIIQWGKAGQFPDGPVALPSLAHWRWTVSRSGHDDTPNWTESSKNLQRSATWQNATYVATGVPDFVPAVKVDAATNSTVTTAGAGFVVGKDLTTNFAQTLALAKPLHPAFIRWSQAYNAPATWGGGKNPAKFNLTHFGPMWNFTRDLGSQAILSVPAGSWGDGNILPAGMPLNKTLLVNWYGHSTGYFPTAAAYATYLTAFAEDLKSHGWIVPYWNIGNEVPVWISMSYAKAFAVVFNAGVSAIHSVFPTALVGSDVLTAPGKMSFFASSLKNVGFLGIHFYPSGHLCGDGTTFCIPNDVNGYLTDSSIIANSSGEAHSWQFVAPGLSRIEWHNLTGNWLPVIDTETNLNTAQDQGTDPRQQTLFAAAWLSDSYITASTQSMKGVVSYSLLSNPVTPDSPTKAYGGWGFGLAVEPNATTTIPYAPYWAANLWGTSIPAGAKTVEVQTGNAYFIRAMAARDGSDLQLVIVNLADVNATVPVTLTGGSFAPTNVRILDHRSYQMVYEGKTKSERLLKSGILAYQPAKTGGLSVRIDGYGVAVVTFAPKAPAGVSEGQAHTPSKVHARGVATLSFATTRAHRSSTNSGLLSYSADRNLSPEAVMALPRWS